MFTKEIFTFVSAFRGTRSAGARRVGEGFDALPRPSWTSHSPPQTTRVATLDPKEICEVAHTAPGPGPQSWSFAGGKESPERLGGRIETPPSLSGPSGARSYKAANSIQVSC